MRMEIRALRQRLERAEAAEAERRRELQSMFMEMAAKIGREIDQNNNRPTTSTIDDGTDSQLPALVTNDGAMPSRPFEMFLNHKTLQGMWDEWHGNGKYDDGGGGIEGRNKKYKARWRRHLGQHYSRTQRIITMIKAKSQQDECSVEETLAKLQPLFTECGHFLSKMISKCQEMGYIVKQKPRGRKRSAEKISDG